MFMVTRNARTEDANTNMRALGEENGYIVVQPTAPGGNWLDVGGDHKRGIMKMVHQALAVDGWHIDTNKVHFMGFSQGAMVTADFICEQTDLFASFVVMEAANGVPTLTCLKATSFQPPVLLQNGIHDLSSKYSLWEKSFPHVKASWGLDDGVKIAGDGTTWDRIRHVGHSGEVFEFLNYTYVADYFLQGHCFPGGTNLVTIPGQAGPYSCPGKKEQAKGEVAGYKIGEEAMKFFIDHPRKAVVSV